MGLSELTLGRRVPASWLTTVVRLHRLDLLARAGEPNTAGRCAMEQVADWLEKLGLGQYAERFADNDISFSVLPDLTDQDL
jgi:hypothetical protein